MYVVESACKCVCVCVQVCVCGFACSIVYVCVSVNKSVHVGLVRYVWSGEDNFKIFDQVNKFVQKHNPYTIH